MTLPITFTQVQQRIKENQLRHDILELHDGVFVVVLELGGRILGPFLSENAASIAWMNDIWTDADAFSTYIMACEWNLGGERIWISPELQYSVRDRNDFWGTITTPQAIDPGNYSLEGRPGNAYHLSQQCTLQAYNLASGSKTLDIERSIRPAANPLQGLTIQAELMEDVIYAGYEHTLTLSETKSNEIMSEGWNVLQLNPGGEIWMPASPEIEYSDYFAPVDASHQIIDRDYGYVRLRISGRKQFKVGYKAAHLYGRLGYVNELNDGRSYLLMRNFFNNPSASYAEEPPLLPGCNGHSVHVYNDGGGFGGFGELEVMGQTIGGETGRNTSTDQFLLWLFAGPQQKIKRLARHLLGIPLNTSSLSA